MKKYLLAFCLLVGNGYALLAQEQFIPPRPERFTPVVDSAQVLWPAQIQSLTQTIKRFEDSTGTQIAVVLLPSLKGYTVEEYAFQWFKKWEYGQQKNNNGVLIFAAINDRKVHIEVGYGLEGAIPDAYAKRIIENQIKPNFRGSNYFQGVNEAVYALIELANGEAYEETAKEPVEWYWYLLVVIFLVLLPLVLVILIIVWIVKAIKKKPNATTYTSQGTQNTFIPPPSSSYSDSSDTPTKHSYSDYSDYSDKSSYSDYSDYSDSGGGSSGGGGASGSW